MIVIDCSVTAVTVTVRVKLLDVIPFWVAVMTLDPALTPVLIPPAVRLATAGLEELQVAEFVTSCVLPSVKVPVAVN